jgi:hypothetical protein
VDPVPEDLVGVGVGTGVRWTSFADKLAARAQYVADLSGPTDHPVLALQRAKMLEAVQANPIVPPDPGLPVRTMRTGPWPFDRLRRVGATQEPVPMGPLVIHEDRWEDLDRDLTEWGF